MDKASQFFAALGGAILSFAVGIPAIVWVLIAVMTLDYVTGLICGAMGVSNKTEHGGLSSKAAFTGLLKKVLILLVVILAALLDSAVATSADIQFDAVTGATCLWFVASEGISILENAANIGLPIPDVLRKVLEVMRSKGGINEDDKEK